MNHSNVNAIEYGIRVLEEEMRKRYSEREPSVLTPPSENSGEEKHLWLQWANKCLTGSGILLVIFFLFAPSSPTVPLKGKVVAREMHALDVKTNGEIVEIRKSNGDSVRAGEVIARIYDPLLHQEEERLRAEVAAGKVEIENLKKKISGETQILNSDQKLYEAGDLARIKLERQQIKVQETTGWLASKNAELQEKQIRLDSTAFRINNETIRSPFDGIIVSNVESKLNTQLQQGRELCHIASGGFLFELGLTEEAVPEIKTGQQVNLQLEAFPGRNFSGRIEEIRPIVFEDYPKPWIKTHNAHVLVSALSDLPEELKLGMTANSALRLHRKTGRLLRWIHEWAGKLKNG